MESALCEFKTPCDDTFYYPARLALLGTQMEYSLFCVISMKSGLAYIVNTTQNGGINFLRNGSLEEIMTLYEQIPWKEIEIIDEKGTFTYKRIPSYENLKDYFQIN